jgi:hypothetical protein
MIMGYVDQDMEWVIANNIEFYIFWQVGYLQL